MNLRISSTLIYDSFRILDYLMDQRSLKSSNTYSLSYLTTIDPKYIVQFLEKIGLLKKINDSFELDIETSKFLEKHNKDVISKNEYRYFIEQYIRKMEPSWAGRIIYGRREIYCFLNKEEQRCFCLAGLYENYDQDTVDWWDNIASFLREKSNINKLNYGRNGEKLTIDYEEKRIGVKPKYVAIDSNLLGYDVISFVNLDKKEKLYIESKYSEKPYEYASFYVSSHEWSVAHNNKNYRFYIWYHKNNEIKLEIKTPEEIMPHIPLNSGIGEWTTVEIKISNLI